MINSASVVALSVALPLLDCAIVGVRLFVKKRRTGKFTADDYLITLSLVILLGIASMSIYGAVDEGLGKVAHKLNPQGGLNTDQDERLVVTKHITKSAAIITPFVLGTAKLSVLAFYRTIFVGKTFNVLSILVIVLVCCWMTFSFFLDLFQCGTRIPVMWTSAKNVAEICLPGIAIGLSVAAVDVFTDVCILLLPIYWIIKLHLPTWKKACVSLIFLFGAITVAVSIIRLVELSLVYPGKAKNPNQFLYLTTLVFFLVLESGLSIIAACLPILGPLFTKGGRLKLRSSRRYTPSTSARTPIVYKHPWFIRSKEQSTTIPLSDVSRTQFIPTDAQGENCVLETTATRNTSSGSTTEVESYDGDIRVFTKINHESHHIEKS